MSNQDNKKEKRMKLKLNDNNRLLFNNVVIVDVSIYKPFVKLIPPGVFLINWYWEHIATDLDKVLHIGKDRTNVAKNWLIENRKRSTTILEYYRILESEIKKISSGVNRHKWLHDINEILSKHPYLL